MRSRNFSPQTCSVLQVMFNSNPDWRHGYDLSQETGVASGTLYPMLIRLAERGLLESCWGESETPGRPPRHMYRLSPQGVELVRNMALSPETSLGGATKARS